MSRTMYYVASESKMTTFVVIAIFSHSFLFFTGCEKNEVLQTDILPAEQIDTLNLVFTIGEEIGDSTNTFCSVTAADIDDRDRIFVLDEVDGTVRVYDSAGNYMTHLAESGPGPGEIIWPEDVCVLSDGRVLIVTGMKGYIVFNDSLEFVEEIHLWENNSPYNISPLGGKLVAAKFDENPETCTMQHTIGIYSLRNTELEQLLWVDSLSVSLSQDTQNPSIVNRYLIDHEPCTSGDREGHVFMGVLDTLQYRVIGWDSTGSRFLDINRTIQPVIKSCEEMEAEAIYLTYTLEALSGQNEETVQPYRHRFMVAEVGIGPDGNLWVRRGTRTDLFFDIYSLEGELLRQAVYPRESWSWKTEITRHGILAWELDPLEGYQQLLLLSQ